MKELKAELLKYRRTFTGKLIVWIPLFFAVYAFVIGMIMEIVHRPRKWHIQEQAGLCFWHWFSTGGLFCLCPLVWDFLEH